MRARVIAWRGQPALFEFRQVKLAPDGRICRRRHCRAALSSGEFSARKSDKRIEIVQEGEVADHGDGIGRAAAAMPKRGRYIAVDAAEAAIAEAAQGFSRAAGKPFRRRGWSANWRGTPACFRARRAPVCATSRPRTPARPRRPHRRRWRRRGRDRGNAPASRAGRLDPQDRGTDSAGSALIKWLAVRPGSAKRSCAETPRFAGAPVALQPIAGPAAHRRPAKTQRPVERRRVAGEVDRDAPARCRRPSGPEAQSERHRRKSAR